MRAPHLCLIAIVAASASLAAQSKPKAAPTKPLTLTGCVAQSDNPDQLTIEDKTGTYRLTGKDVHHFLGQRVQIVGGVIRTKKLDIKGGLVPSPNAAAQAGAIDPARAATEAAGGQAPTGNVQLPEFRVRTVKPLGASCK